jgi:glycosyltransferase involved in cell wall biosynthesis
MTPNAPAYWPSVSIILPEFIRLLEGLFPKLQRYDFLTEKHLPKKSDVWIFPAGSVQTFALNWMSACFPNPMERPPAIFLLGGEGAKLGYHLFHYRKLFRPDDQWIVACDAEKKLLEDFFPGNDRTHVMYHPVAAQFRPAASAQAKQELRRKLGFSAQDKLMIYAGRLSQQKNLIPLIDVIQNTPKLQLVICGDTDSVGVPHLQGAKPQHVPSALIERIRRAGVSSRVQFRPFQSQPELRAIMQACDYQISLSAHYGEDFGYSIAQGLCAGLKTLLSDWGGHRNWLSLAEKKQVSYVPLDWSNGIEVGQPLLNRGIQLPQRAISPDFHREYQKMTRSQFLDVLEKTFKSRERDAIEPAIDLVRFWKEASEKQTSTMYSSTEHPLFKKVVRLYQGLT